MMGKLQLVTQRLLLNILASQVVTRLIHLLGQKILQQVNGPLTGEVSSYAQSVASTCVGVNLHSLLRGRFANVCACPQLAV